MYDKLVVVILFPFLIPPKKWARIKGERSSHTGFQPVSLLLKTYSPKKVPSNHKSFAHLK